MSGRRYSPEEIISKLREAEVLLAQGVGVGEVVRCLGVTSVTSYRWRIKWLNKRWLHHRELVSMPDWASARPAMNAVSLYCRMSDIGQGFRGRPTRCHRRAGRPLHI